MDMTPTYWEDNSAIQHVKFERCNAHDEVSRMKDERPVYTCCDTNLNFSTATCSEDDCEYGPYKKNKVARQDPMSHRIIEKRRRDRMNNCLADLSRLIPTEYLKKGRGRIEKTEIIEMAIKHMKYLQQDHGSPTEHYRLGYQECMSEVMRFMVEVEGHFPREAVCVRLLNHLQKHCESISRTSPYTQPRTSQPQQQPTTEHIVPVPNVHETPPRNETPIMKMDYQVPKKELEQNNNNNNSSFVIRSTNNNNASSIIDADYEKQHPDMNGGGMMSYKYKTNIKLRFTQDINGAHHEEMMGSTNGTKHQKLDCSRRNSCTSIENQSSSHSSPPSSELCTRISDSEINNRHSPSDSTLSITNSANNNNNLKLENGNGNDIDIRYCSGGGSSPSTAMIKNHLHHSTSRGDIKHNFNVPIFVLHAKGSYYVPLMIDYKTLLPFLQNYNILEVVPAAMRNIVLHPVTINVNFLPNFNTELTNNNNNSKYKNEFSNNWH